MKVWLGVSGLDNLRKQENIERLGTRVSKPQILWNMEHQKSMYTWSRRCSGTLQHRHSEMLQDHIHILDVGEFYVYLSHRDLVHRKTIWT